MSEDKQIREPGYAAHTGDHFEEKGVLTEVVVPIVAGGAGGAAGSYVTNLMNRPGDPPPPPEPTIELPPGVDGD
jgi:hypothetical protein